MKYELYTDGSCFPNPGGEAAYGFVLFRNGHQINYGYGRIGKGPFMDSVHAELYAISQGLTQFIRYINDVSSVKLRIYCDSSFVVDQVLDSGINFQEVQMIKYKIHQLKDLGVDVNIQWIPREQNKADVHAKFFRA